MAIRKVGGGTDAKPSLGSGPQRNTTTNRPLGISPSSTIPGSSGTTGNSGAGGFGTNVGGSSSAQGGGSLPGSPGLAPVGGGSALSSITPRLNRNATINHTMEEAKCIETLLHAFSNTAHPLSAEEGDKLWRQHLERVVAITEKVLQLAGNNFDPPPNAENTIAKKEAASANPSHASGNTTTTTTAGESHPVAEFFTDVPLEDDHRTPAERLVDFQKDNQYIIGQLREFQWCPFTVVRLLEILQDPHQFFTAGATVTVGSRAKKGNLRGPKLQEAIRRCVLVTSPFYASSTTGEPL